MCGRGSGRGSLPATPTLAHLSGRLRGSPGRRHLSWRRRRNGLLVDGAKLPQFALERFPLAPERRELGVQTAAEILPATRLVLAYGGAQFALEPGFLSLADRRLCAGKSLLEAGDRARQLGRMLPEPRYDVTQAA